MFISNNVNAIITDMKPEIIPSLNSQEKNVINQEVGLAKSAELQTSVEASSVASELASLTSFPAPSISDTVVNDQSAIQPILNIPDDSGPKTASDNDVIEREWVDRAKRIVNETKEDPYLQEKKVSELQVDYLKKRFGKVVGL